MPNVTFYIILNLISRLYLRIWKRFWYIHISYTYMCLFITISCVCTRYVYIYHTGDSHISSSSIYFLITQGNCPTRRGKTPGSLSLRKRKKKKRIKGDILGKKRWRESREDVHFSKEQSYITAREKRPSTGRLISKALPPAPFTSSPNPRALHEFRHSEPNPSHHSLSVPLQTYDREARRKAPSCAIFPMISPLTLQRIEELQG